MHCSRPAIFLFFYCLLACPGVMSGQLSPADSVVMQQKFGENLYMLPSLFPGNWYVHEAVNSPLAIDSFLDQQMPFSSPEFDAAYRQIQVAGSLVADTALNPTFNQYYTLYGNAYKQLDPLVTLDFQLNGKHATAYSTYSPTSSPADREIAFLVLPGSNPNQTTELMIGSGYHNTNCYIKNILSGHGDVFILCKPLEDYRALRWNDKKLNSSDYITPGLNYIYHYLDSVDRPYGINYLVEAMALMKYLKTHYRKVMLLGCSQGGYASLLLSLQTEPDATLIASGYSKYIDDDSLFQYELMQNFKQLPLQYNSNLVKSKLSVSPTDYLFCWPDNDSYWYQFEHDTHGTQAFLGNMKNISYFYDYSGHSFPTCYTIDTFIRKTIDKPKLFFTLTDSLLHGRMRSKIDFSGRGPFSFNVYRNQVLYQHVDWVSSAFELTLPGDGQYFLGDITNLNGEAGVCFDTLTIHHVTQGALFDEGTPGQIGQNKGLALWSVPEYSGNALQDFNGAEARVYNLAGQEMANTRISDGKLQIDISSWPAGMYIVRLRNQHQFKQCKFYKTE